MISNVRQFLAAVPAVSIALLSHVDVCPACWPFIGGLMSFLGLTFLSENRFLLPLMIGCLVVAITALGRGAQRNYWPLILGIVASGVILLGKFALDAGPVTIGGAGLLVGAYFWSFWLRRSSQQSCCAPATTIAAERSMASETMTSPDIPIACALGQGQFKERKELLQRLAKEATERRKLPNGVSLCFQPVSGRVTELAKLVDLERACCPFLAFRIDALAGGPVWLELTGTAAAPGDH